MSMGYLGARNITHREGLFRILAYPLRICRLRLICVATLHLFESVSELGANIQGVK